VDDLPLPTNDVERKLFVVCEMKVGEDIIADIAYTGNTKGTKSEPVEDFENYTFAIAEGETDLAFDFIYNGREKNYFIPNKKLNLKQGERYKFRGIGSNGNFTDPVVTIPTSMNLSDVKTEIVALSQQDGKYFTKVKCNVELGLKYDDETYFFIIPTTGNGNKGKTTFIKDFQAFKDLSHKNGFLVDYNRITNNEIEFFFEFQENIPSDTINIEFGNVSPSFYWFNHYYSNLVSGIEFETSNPAISGLNVKTDKAYGTFSAISSFTKQYKIR
jgi:hypothetical protein